METINLGPIEPRAVSAGADAVGEVNGPPRIPWQRGGEEADSRVTVPVTAREIGSAAVSAVDPPVRHEIATEEPTYGPDRVRLALYWHVVKAAEVDSGGFNTLLDAEGRAALDLYLDHEKTMADIAETLGVSPTTVVERGNDIILACQGILHVLPESERTYVARHAAAEIREIIKELGVKQVPMSIALDMSTATINRFLRGASFPELATVQKMLAYMHVPAGEAEAILAAYASDRAEWEKARMAGQSVTGPRPTMRAGVGPELATLRREQGVPRAVLAGLGGIAVSTLDAVLQGRQYTDTEVMARILEGLQVAPESAAGYLSRYQAEMNGVVDTSFAELCHDVGPIIRDAWSVLTQATKLPQSVLAERAGISLPTLQRILAGTSYADVSVIQTLLELVDIPPDDISQYLEQYAVQKNTRTAALNALRRSGGAATRQQRRSGGK